MTQRRCNHTTLPCSNDDDDIDDTAMEVQIINYSASTCFFLYNDVHDDATTEVQTNFVLSQNLVSILLFTIPFCNCMPYYYYGVVFVVVVATS